MVKLHIEELSFSYQSTTPILHTDNLEIASGEVTALIGANAAGKSTFLKCIAGLLKYQGKILLSDKELNSVSAKERTEIVSYLPQDTSFKVMLTVFEAVLLGNLQSLSWRVDDEDLAKTRQLMEELNIIDLAYRYLSELSGGQRQVVSIAQAIIRNPQILLLDEPTNNLDLQRQLEIMDFVKKSTGRNRITVVALHDLNLAIKYADNLVVFKNGRVYAAGKPEEIITEDMIKDVYGVHARVKKDEGVLQVLPICSTNTQNAGMMSKIF